MTTRKFGDRILSIPIYCDSDWVNAGKSTNLYYALIVIEFAMIVYNSILASLGIVIIRQSSIFHRNMLNLGIVLLVNAYSHFIARSILILVQLKFVIPEESSFLTLSNIVIIFGSVLRHYQTMMIVVLFGSLVVERLFATIFFGDYEKKERSWISYTLILSTILLSSCLGIASTFYSETFTGEILLAIVRGYTCIPAGIAIVLVILNQRRVTRILMSNQYSLGAKFQLKENMRAFKFLLLFVVWIIVGVGCACLIFFYRDRHSDDLNVVALCGAAYETVTTITYGGGLTTCCLTQPEWRFAMKIKLARTLFPWRRPVDHNTPQPSRLPPSLRANQSNRIDDVSAAYFNNLFNEWNRAYESRSEK